MGTEIGDKQGFLITNLTPTWERVLRAKPQVTFKLPILSVLKPSPQSMIINYPVSIPGSFSSLFF